MASGTPVVAVKEGVVRETIIHNKIGIITERDGEIFTQAISKLLIGAEKRERMVKGCIRVVHNLWTLEHAKERLNI